MATPFVRVDLSSASRDFEPTTLEMGLPLLDERNARYQMLRKWLGAQVAEPEYKDQQVAFFLRSPAGARLERAECWPATEQELQGPLKKEYDNLLSSIARAEAKSPDEKKVLRVVREELESFSTDARQHLRCSSLFRYRDHNRQLRLVWCPGYRRKDPNPAGPLICTNPNCLHLFVRRGGSHKCPYCLATKPPPPPPPPPPVRLLRLLVLLVLAGGGGAILFWYFAQQRDAGQTGQNPAPVAAPAFAVQPTELNLTVGQLAELKITSRPDLPIRIVSSAPEVVEVTADNQLLGRAPGICQVDVTQGAKDHAAVKVTVGVARFDSLEFSPQQIVLRIGESREFQVVGKTGSGEDVKLSPEVLDWVGRPDPEFAEVNTTNLRIRGLKPTRDVPQFLGVRFAGQKATGRVEVVTGELKLELTADGPTALPEGQKLSLQVWAAYEGGQREQIANDRVEFEADPVAGLVVGNGFVEAPLRPLDSVSSGSESLKVKARFEGVESNELEIKRVASAPLAIALTANPAALSVNETGSATLSATSPTGPVAISPIGATFESSDPEVLAIDRTSGDFRALKTGNAVITGSYEGSNRAASGSVKVVDPVASAPPAPKAVRLVVDQSPPVRISVGSRFTGLRIETEESDGKRRDVTAEGTLLANDDPSTAAVSLQDGQVIAVRPGKSVVRAVFAGVESDPVEFEVTETIEIDEIRVTPAAVTLAIGESPRLTAVGYKNGNNVGTLTELKDLEWRIKDTGSQNTEAPADGVFPGEGPVFTREALQPGTVEITAVLGQVVSNPVQVTIVDTPEQVPDKLTVTPESLQLTVGESRPFGTRVKAARGNHDVTDNAQVSSAAPEIVAFNEELRALVGIAPGRTQVTVAFGGQLAPLDVEVTAEQAPTAETVMGLEPAGGTLRVGERLTLRGFEDCGSCAQGRTDRTASLRLDSSAPDVIAVEGATLVGLKPGKATISANLPGLGKPATAEFTVVDEPEEFSQLTVEPSTIRLNVGQRRKYVVYGMGAKGRTKLGDHPDLKVTVEGPTPGIIESDLAVQEVRGVGDGDAELVFQWRNTPPRRIPVKVKSSPVTAIRIMPDAATVAAGDAIDLQAFGRRGGEWEPLTAADGVTLRVMKGNVAEVVSGLQVKGLRAGSTQVVALHTGHRATASLKVTPANAPNAPAAPAGKPIGLRFIWDTRVVTLGSPGDRIRVVAEYPNGRREDVDHRVTLTVRDPQDVVKIERTGSGPLVVPQKLGQTQLDAELDGVRTRRPLLVDVVEARTGQAHLRVRPNPILLEVGKSHTIERVEVNPGRGGQPFTLPFKVEVSQSPIIEITGTNTIRALKNGSANAAVTVVDPSSKYDGLTTAVRVEVGNTQNDEDRPLAHDGAASPSPADSTGEPREGEPDRARLVLSGPEETTVGAEIALKCELVAGPNSGRDVTSAAQLSVPADDRERVELMPGCRLLPKSPGTLRVEARQGGAVSNVHEIRVKAPSAAFKRLELALATTPMTTGEKRPYKVWGHPSDGSPRQDLTSRVADGPPDREHPQLQITVVEPNAGSVPLKHEPGEGELIAAAAGTAKLVASLGDNLKTDPVEVQVTGTPSEATVQALKIEPEEITIEAGKLVKFKVFVRSLRDMEFREITDAKLESLAPEILAPAADQTHQFEARQAGTAKVEATYCGLKQLANVRVAADWFKSLVSVPTIGRDKFTIDVEVTGDRTVEELEYRLLTDPNVKVKPAWTAAKLDDQKATVKLKSPSLPLDENKQVYKVYIQARDKKKPEEIQLYPYSFRFATDPTQYRGAPDGAGLGTDREKGTGVGAASLRTTPNELAVKGETSDSGESDDELPDLPQQSIDVAQGSTDSDSVSKAALADFNARLKREGAKSGDVQISLLWNNANDLDLHVRAPSGEKIWYQNRRSACRGELDVDMNAEQQNSKRPIENVYWSQGLAPSGRYQVYVHHYLKKGGPKSTRFRMRISNGSQTKLIAGRSDEGQGPKLVYEFTH